LETKEDLSKKIDESVSKLEENKKTINVLKIKVNEDKVQLETHLQNSKTMEDGRKYIEKCKLFYEQVSKYKDVYHQRQEIKRTYEMLDKKKKDEEKARNTISEKLNQRTPNYKKLELLNTEIFKLNDEIKELKQNELKKIEFQSLQERKEQKLIVAGKLQSQIEQLEIDYQNIDKTNMDLNNKKDIITKVQSALNTGDTCPVCGNQVHSIEQHLDFDELTKRHQQLTKIDQQRSKEKEEKIKCDSELNYLEEQIAKFNQEELNNTNYKEIEAQLYNKYKEKERVENENEEIRQLIERLQESEQSFHNLELEIKNTQHILQEKEVAINDFEQHTSFSDVEEFVKYYDNYLEKLKTYDNVIHNLEENIQEAHHKLSLEQNSKKYLETHYTDLKRELENIDTRIKNEMERIGFTDFNQVKEAIDKLVDKHKIEEEIYKYNKETQKIKIVITQLNEQTKDKKLQDSKELKEAYQHKQQQLEHVATELSQHEYKIDFNQKKFKEINTTIEKLEKELKEQQEVFQLAEILSGKNDQKLTLENYVLIYYLERILAQANQRLSLMTGQRYQLTRREQISQGYSGLEINVFDSHSNQSRHITSLSGGETFQASLALALGLSEVVQQESGGISLDSMFVDEGFGTLDQETLETALDTLLSLKSTGRMVGIISHVSELKQRIPLILEVQTEQYQSKTKFIKQ